MRHTSARASTRPTGRELRVAGLAAAATRCSPLLPAARGPRGARVGRAGRSAAAWPGWWRVLLGVVAGAPRLVRPVGRPPHPLGLAALDGLPRPPLGRGCWTTASSPATTAAPATTLCPRVLRVRSVTPSIDTLAVRMVRGQDLQTWTDHTPALADALHARTRRRHPPPPRGAHRDRGTAQPVPPRPRRHPHPRHLRRGRPVAARRRGQRVRRPVPAQPARQAPARRRRLRRGQVLAAVEPAARGRADDPRRLAAGVDDRSEGRHRNRPRPGPVPPLGHHPRRRHRAAHRLPRLHARPPAADARPASPPLRDHRGDARTSC